MLYIETGLTNRLSCQPTLTENVEETTRLFIWSKLCYTLPRINLTRLGIQWHGMMFEQLRNTSKSFFKYHKPWHICQGLCLILPMFLHFYKSFIFVANLWWSQYMPRYIDCKKGQTTVCKKPCNSRVLVYYLNNLQDVRKCYLFDTWLT